MLESPSDGISFGRRQVSSFEFEPLLFLAPGLCSLLFLCLMVVDPALSTLNGHYEPQPVECRVLDSRHVIGNSNTNCLLDIRLLSTNSHFKHYLYYETRDSPYYIIKLIRQLLCQKHLRQSQLLQKILQA